MNSSIGETNDQRRLDPGLAPHPRGQIISTHRCEERDKRRLLRAEHNRAAADHGQARVTGGSLQSISPLFGIDAHEQATRLQVRSCDPSIVADVSAQLEPARDLLRVLALNTGTRRKIRRTPDDKVESLLRGQRARIPEVPVADLKAVVETVVPRRLSRQTHASPCASMVTTREPARRQAAIMPTEPMPDPRSSTSRADGAHAVAYHAVSRSSVEKRWPCRSWKIRKWPLMASSVSSGGTSIDTRAPGGTGSGFVHPLKSASTFRPVPIGLTVAHRLRAVLSQLHVCAYHEV